MSYGNSRQNLNDIDRAIAFLEGKKLESVPCTAVCAREGHLKACGDDFSGVPFESTYFEMRCYKKGTLHMHFKDKELWERFNLTAARGKNWLPDDVKARGAGGSHLEQADRPVRASRFPPDRRSRRNAGLFYVFH